jgi:carboxyl-terminal processing protease
MNCKKLFAVMFLVLTAASFNVRGQAIVVNPHAGLVPPLPPERQLELDYQYVWQTVADVYYSPQALANWGKWQHKYDGKLKDTADLDAAIKEMLSSLNDRWTRYVGQREMVKYRAQQLLGAVWSGVELQQWPDGSCRVASLLYGSPAHKSRLREGDVVEAVDGQSLKGLSQAELMQLVCGQNGSTLEIAYLESGKRKNLKLTFANTPDAEVEARMVGSIAYARLPDFDDQQRVDSFEEALLKLYRESNGKIEGLVLDLRNNPGGSTNTAYQMVSLLLEKGIFVSTYTRNKQVGCLSKFRIEPAAFELDAASEKEKIALSRLLHTVPLVLMVNGSSASASELMCGALKDNMRAKVVGTRTFGKGVGYRGYDLSSGGSFTVTEMSFARPNGLAVQGKGIQPNVVLEQPRDGGDGQLELAVRKIREMAASSKR